MDKHNSCVLVTGSSRGIGASLAVAFAQDGYGRIGINYSGDSRGAEETAENVRKLGAEAIVLQADVSSREGVEKLFRAYYDAFGQIDVLVNNAGGALRVPDGGFADMPLDYWDSQINLNLNAAAYCSHEAVRNMIDRGAGGSIINISSIHSLVTWVKRKMLPYAAAKAGLNMFTKALAVEVIRHGIYVNAVAPGFISTAISNRYSKEETDAFKRKIPAGFLGEVGDINPIVLLLADREKSRFIVGQTIVVDGGQSIDGAMDQVIH